MTQTFTEKDMLEILGKLTRYDSLVGFNIEKTAFREFSPAEAYYWLGYDGMVEALAVDSARFEKIISIVDWIDSMDDAEFTNQTNYKSKAIFMQTVDFNVLVSIAESYQREKEKEQVNKDIIAKITEWVNSMNKYELIAITGTDDVNEILHTSYDDLKPLMDEWDRKKDKLHRDVKMIAEWFDTLTEEEKAYYVGYQSLEEALKNLGMTTLLIFKNAVDNLPQHERISRKPVVEEAYNIPDNNCKLKEYSHSEQNQRCPKINCLSNKQCKNQPVINTKPVQNSYRPRMVIKQVGPFTFISREV